MNHPSEILDTRRDEVPMLSETLAPERPLDESPLGDVPRANDGTNGAVVRHANTTERKRTEAALRASEAKFRTLTEAMPHIVWVTRPDGWNTYLSQQWMDYTGLTLEESLGHGWNRPFHPDDQQGARDAWQSARTTLRTYSIECRLRRADGVYRWWLIRGVPTCDSSGNVLKWVGTCTDIHDLKQAERDVSSANQELRESNEKFYQLADHITDAFWIRSPDMREVHYLSPAYERIWGRSAASLCANQEQWIGFIHPEDRERVQAAFTTLMGEAPSLDVEYRIVRPDGEIRTVRVRGFQVRGAENKLIRLIGIVTDMTDRKRLEAQLFQSQKMETVGKLAGGVAHEFNSIMTAIIGQSELLLSNSLLRNPLRQNVIEIRGAAERAATLTRQLLAYGRKQILQPEILDLNTVLTRMAGTLRHLMGRGTEVRIAAAEGTKAVKADADQIEQVIINLAMNAAAAMPQGGELTLETSNVTLNSDQVRSFPELLPGEYVKLAVIDSGTGMSEAVKARLFEPFFTTKPVGQGTGLGLSTCYGIIKQSGGHISVASEPGRGAAFTIYLPPVPSPDQNPPARLEPLELPRGTETILLVEDDLALGEMAANLLRRLGYTVFAAASSLEALNAPRPFGHIDLLFTDVVLPHMSGRELAERVQALYPHIRILFTADESVHALVPRESPSVVAWLQKPFTPYALAHKLREILDGSRTA